ncbi:MAG: cell division protein ZapA [bacterium]|nr:cell division protein ZapA [bacterium]
MAELSIKLKIGNREYPMKVKAEDEAMIRQAGKTINERIKNYRDKFGIDDIQDLLAMVAFDCLVEKTRSDEQVSNIDDVALEQVQAIKNLISNNL